MIVFTAVVAAIASSLVVHVGAQPQGNSSVHCIPGWDWANNTLNQNPCLVSSWLQAECSDKYIMDPLQPGYHYSGPTTDPSTQNACICTTPVYMLGSACGACQNESYISWTAWSTYCPTTMLSSQGQYNPIIPTGTRIPAWAFLKPSDMGDYFNPTQAQLTGDSPERTQVQSSTTSSSASTSSTPTTTSSFTSSSTTTASGGGGGGSNVGAIAGGVAGGVIGLCIIAILAFWLLKNRNKPPADGENNNGAGVQSIRTSQQPLMRPEMATVDSSGQVMGQHTSMAPSVTSGGTTGQGLNSPTTPPGSGPWFPPPQNFAAQQQKYAPPIQNPDEAYLHAHAMAGPAWSGVPNV